MESLFRFVQVRPPSITGNRGEQAEVKSTNEVGKAIEGVLKATTVSAQRDANVGINAAIQKISDIHKLTAERCSELARFLLSTGEDWCKQHNPPKDILTAHSALKALKANTGRTPRELTTDESFKAIEGESSERILAARVGSSENARWLPRLVLLARVIAIIKILPDVIAKDEETNELESRIHIILTRPVRLPASLFPLPAQRKLLMERELLPQFDVLKQKLVVAIEQKGQSIERLKAAFDFVKLAERAESLREQFYRALLDGKPDIAQGMSKRIETLRQELEEVAPRATSSTMARAADRAYRELLSAARTGLAFDAGEATVQLQTTSTKGIWKKQSKRRVIRIKQMPTLKLAAPELLSSYTHNLLVAAGMDPSKESLPKILIRARALMSKETAVGKPIVIGRFRQKQQRVGEVLPGFQIYPGFELFPDEGETQESLPGVPTTVGTVRPSGIGDLLVVRQHIKRYDAGEIAHIENVVPGETRERQHERTVESTATITVEAETERTEERDLSTTERFEMSRETSQTVSTDIAMHAGLSASYKYGPTLTVNAEASADINRTTEKSQKEAKTYASDVTSRTASRITERALKRQEQMLRQIIYEKNLHKLSGVGYQAPGVYRYQWQNKVYEAQIYNYGKRLLFDIVVPEPASLFIRAARGAVNETVLQEPAPLTETVVDINEGNYADIAARYGSTIPEPPPAPFLTDSWSVQIDPQDDSRTVSGNTEKTIQDGFQLHQVIVTLSGLSSDDRLDVTVAGHTVTFDMVEGSPWQYYFDAGEQTGIISITYTGYEIYSAGFNVQLLCMVTDHAREEWRNKAYATIRDAYLTALDNYNKALAAQATNAVPVVMGRNPDANRVTERMELRRLCIETITAQHFTQFGAVVERGDPPLPEINLAEAEQEGSYIRFIEEAFEWESISYQFYPYFWSRRSTWIDRVLFSEKDPLFNEFLRAGAARVTVAVRAGYENVVAEFLETGKPWGTSGVPDTSSDAYQSVAELIREVTDSHGKGEQPYGDSWEIVIPTELVAIREKKGSPEWTFKGGTWQLTRSEDAMWPSAAAIQSPNDAGGGG